jgi:hypothetical protein
VAQPSLHALDDDAELQPEDGGTVTKFGYHAGREPTDDSKSAGVFSKTTGEEPEAGYFWGNGHIYAHVGRRPKDGREMS